MHSRITAEKAWRVSQLAGGCFVESKIPSPENAFHKREREQVGVVAWKVLYSRWKRSALRGSGGVPPAAAVQVTFKFTKLVVALLLVRFLASPYINWILLFTAALALRSRGLVIGSREKEEEKEREEKEEEKEEEKNLQIAFV